MSSQNIMNKKKTKSIRNKRVANASDITQSDIDFCLSNKGLVAMTKSELKAQLSRHSHRK